MPRMCCFCQKPESGPSPMFMIPTVKQGESDGAKAMTEKRRAKWLAAGCLQESTLTTQRPVVCWRHFTAGKPAYRHDWENRDWVPHLNLPSCMTRGNESNRSECIKRESETIETETFVVCDSANKMDTAVTTSLQSIQAAVSSPDTVASVLETTFNNNALAPSQSTDIPQPTHTQSEVSVSITSSNPELSVIGGPLPTALQSSSIAMVDPNTPALSSAAMSLEQTVPSSVKTVSQSVPAVKNVSSKGSVSANVSYKVKSKPSSRVSGKAGSKTAHKSHSVTVSNQQQPKNKSPGDSNIDTSSQMSDLCTTSEGIVLSKIPLMNSVVRNQLQELLKLREHQIRNNLGVKLDRPVAVLTAYCMKQAGSNGSFLQRDGIDPSSVVMHRLSGQVFVGTGRFLPVVCEHLCAVIHLGKFFCPGTHRPCVEFEGGLITPFNLLQKAGFQYTSNWEAIFRVGDGSSIKMLMKEGSLDFTRHNKFCSGRCRRDFSGKPYPAVSSMLRCLSR